MDALNLRNARVLITGGAGLIGSHIADRLVAESVGRDRRARQLRPRPPRESRAAPCASGRVTIVEGDIRDRALVAEAMQGIDVVFHQAAIRITQCAEEPALAIDVLVNGTFNVLEAAVQAGVRKVVAASSASVYGLADDFRPTNSITRTTTARSTARRRPFNEGLLRAFNEQYGLELRRAALLQRLRPAHGHARRLHRGVHPLDGAHRRGRAADDLRRRHADDGLRLRRRHRAREHPGGHGAPVSDRGLQRRQRHRSQPERSAPACCCGS